LLRKIKTIYSKIKIGIIGAFSHLKNGYRKNNDFGWVMTDNEKKLFKEYIHKANVYLEFGAGGSTVAALFTGIKRVYSVESDKDYIEHLRQEYKIIRKSEKYSRLVLIHANIGNVGEWGVPIMSDNENNTERFLNYSKRVFEEYGEIKSADVVLIDGRFRVACCLSVLLQTKETTIIIFHDYWNRPSYHIIERFVDYIDRVDTLMVCKKKSGVSNNEIKDEYENINTIIIKRE